MTKIIRSKKRRKKRWKLPISPYDLLPKKKKKQRRQPITPRSQRESYKPPKTDLPKRRVYAKDYYKKNKEHVRSYQQEYYYGDERHQKSVQYHRDYRRRKKLEKLAQQVDPPPS